MHKPYLLSVAVCAASCSKALFSSFFAVFFSCFENSFTFSSYYVIIDYTQIFTEE